MADIQASRKANAAAETAGIMNPPAALTEQEALERVRRGDKSAYHAIIETYMRRVQSVALGFVHNQQDAMDIAQDAFVRAYRSIRRYDPRRPFFPWIYEIVKNLSLNHLRRRPAALSVPLDQEPVLQNAEEDWEMKEVLWREIQALPIEPREMVLLKYFQHMSCREIAHMLGKPEGTVMSTLHGARIRLKKALAGYMGREAEGEPR
jgi:RNA polymerase sigma-70 factor, ECF subfamily